MDDNAPVGIQHITLPVCFWIAIFNRFVPMADPESSDSPQVKLFLECARGFETRDLDLIANTTHKDCCYVIYPRSLGRQEQAKEEWLAHWAGIMSLWTADLDVSYVGCSSDPLSRD